MKVTRAHKTSLAARTPTQKTAPPQRAIASSAEVTTHQPAASPVAFSSPVLASSTPATGLPAPVANHPAAAPAPSGSAAASPASVVATTAAPDPFGSASAPSTPGAAPTAVPTESSPSVDTSGPQEMPIDRPPDVLAKSDAVDAEKEEDEEQKEDDEEEKRELEEEGVDHDDQDDDGEEWEDVEDDQVVPQQQSGIRLPETNRTADAASDDDDFGNDLNMIDTSTCSNDYDALGSGDEPEADDIDRPETEHEYVSPVGDPLERAMNDENVMDSLPPELEELFNESFLSVTTKQFALER